MAVAGVFVLRRRRPELVRPYRTLGYPVLPAFFLVGAGLLLGNYLVSRPVLFGINIAVILAGIPAYYGWKRFAGRGVLPG